MSPARNSNRHSSLLILTLFALKPGGATEDAILISAIAVIQLCQMLSKYLALYWVGKADVPRRMDQLLSGLGMEPSAEKCASLEEEIGKCDEPRDPKYWRSKQPPGPRRMIEMILESSFYTRSLAGECMRLFFIIGTIGLAVAAIVLIVSYRVGSAGKPDELVPHIVLAVLTFFLTGDFWIIGLLYRDLRQAADDSHKQAYVLLKTGDLKQEIALEIALNYNTAVVQAPPLLNFKYLRSRETTDAVFVRNYGQLLGLTD